jgi:hypothetical protein
MRRRVAIKVLCAEEYLARPAADVLCLVESGKEFNTFHPPGWANNKLMRGDKGAAAQ